MAGWPGKVRRHPGCSRERIDGKPGNRKEPMKIRAHAGVVDPANCLEVQSSAFPSGQAAPWQRGWGPAACPKVAPLLFVDVSLDPADELKQGIYALTHPHLYLQDIDFEGGPEDDLFALYRDFAAVKRDWISAFRRLGKRVSSEETSGRK